MSNKIRAIALMEYKRLTKMVGDYSIPDEVVRAQYDKVEALGRRSGSLPPLSPRILELLEERREDRADWLASSDPGR